jgi:hypothetical protein
MKRKNRNILIIIVVVLAVVVGLLSRENRSTLDNKENAFAVADTGSVTKIFLADKSDNQVLLSRKNAGEWLVNDTFPALNENVRLLLKTIKNVTIERPVSNVAHNNVIKRLATRSVKTEIYQKVYRVDLFGKIRLFPHEKNIRTYFVGGETPEKMGTYMLMEGAEKPYVVGLPGFRGFIAPRYTARVGDWRSHGIFKSRIHEIDHLDVVYHEKPDISFRIENINNQSFKLYDLHNKKYVPLFDTVKVVAYLTAYQDIRFEALLNHTMEQSLIDSVKATPPVHTLKLVRHDGNVQEVNTFFMPGAGQKDSDGNLLERDPDRMYASINEGRDFVMIQFYVFDKLLKPIGYFTGDYEEEFRVNFKQVY